MLPELTERLKINLIVMGTAAADSSWATLPSR